MTYIIAIDPGTRSGWATSDGRSGSIDLSPAKARAGKPGRPAVLAKKDGRVLKPAVAEVPAVEAEPEHARCGKMFALVERLWREAPDYPTVVVEGAAAFQRGKAAVRVSHELRGAIKVTCWHEGMPYVEVQPMDLKRHATGRFNADKTDMLAAARAKLGYAGDDEDVADALWVLDWARQFVLPAQASGA